MSSRRVTVALPSGGADLESFLLEGGDVAWATVFERVAATARRIVPPSDAQDVAQEVCIRLYRLASAGRLAHVRDAAAFLRRIAVNAALDHRDNVRPLRSAADRGEGEDGRGVLSLVPAPSERDDTDDETRRLALQQAIAALPTARDRRAVALYMQMLVGLIDDYKDIARILLGDARKNKRAHAIVQRALARLARDPSLKDLT